MAKFFNFKLKKNKYQMLLFSESKYTRYVSPTGFD